MAAPPGIVSHPPEAGRQPSGNPLPSPAFRGIAGSVCGSAVAFAGLASVTARTRNGRLEHLDRAAIRAVRNGRRPAVVTTARAVSTLAEPAFCSLLLTACAVTVTRRTGWRAGCIPCLVVASGTAVRRVMSRMIARPRPPAAGWLAEPEGFSLPSKHTTLAALTTGACARSLRAGGATMHMLPLVAAAGVGASRVYLGVHWPSDILAAWLFAEGWLHLSESLAPAPSRRARHEW